MIQIGDTTIANYQPLDITGTYCRVVIDQPDEDPPTQLEWIGYVVGRWQDRSGVATDPDPDANKLTGRKQYFQAVGLEYFLARRQIDDAVVYDASQPEDYIRIQRPLIFNGGASVNYDQDTRHRGNKHPTATTLSGTPYAFSDGSATPVLWSGQDILWHLMLFQQPTGKTGDDQPIVWLPDFADLAIVAGYYPTIQTERKTVFAVLNELCDARRGLGWWLKVEFSEASGFYVGKLQVASRAASDLALPAGGTLPANADQWSFNFDSQRDVEDPILREDKSRHYDQIIARGARMTVTMTVGTEDGTLEPDWSSALETEYKAAVGGTADENDNYRKDEKFAPVYAAFRIPADWDGKTGDGVGASPLNFAIADLDPGGTPLGTGLPLTTNAIRLVNSTRLLEGYNYAIDASAPTAIHSISSENVPNLMRPFAFFCYVPAGGGTAFCRYAHKLERVLGPVGDLTKSYGLYVLQNRPGIRLPAVAGLNVTLAGDAWSASPAAAASNEQPELDYEVGGTFDCILAATVTIEADKYAEAALPRQP